MTTVYPGKLCTPRIREINVIWTEGPQGGVHGRSGYACCTLLNTMFDQYSCTHWSGIDNYPDGLDGAVLVVHGGNERNRLNLLNHVIKPWKWVVLVVIGDEASEFDWGAIKHPNMVRWIQTPKPGVSPEGRYFVCGFPNDCEEMLLKAGHHDRAYDWFYAGQMTHSRRWQLGVVLERLPRGVFVPTQGFGQGLDHETYYRYLREAKVIPCPSGPATPDTYRMCEALEAGAVPVLDAVSLNEVEGYWEMVFGNDHPLPVLRSWNGFPALLEDVLREYPAIQQMCAEWWVGYKKRFGGWLGEDLRKLGAL